MVVRARSLELELFASSLLTLLALLVITIGRFGFTRGLWAASLFVASLLAHESGHFVIAAITGTEVSTVGVSWKGLYLRRKSAAGAAEFFISAAGPAANIVIAAALWNSSGVTQWVAQMNAVLALINLLPYPGSDGQRIYSLIVRALGGAEPAA